MAHNFRPYEPDQLFLLPPSIDDWVPENSLARFLSELVDTLDDEGNLKSFYASYRADGSGAAAFHPRLILKVLLFGYCHGVTSSRKLAMAVETDVAYRFLAANQRPNFRTLSMFRKRHSKALRRLFVSILEMCKEAGLVKFGRVAIDGRRVRGNASKQKNKKRETIEREIEKILKDADRIDRKEDIRLGNKRGDELPDDLQSPSERLKRLREARDRLAAREAEAQEEYEERLRAREERAAETGKKPRGPKPKPPSELSKKNRKSAQANTTDPDSRLLKTRDGWRQGYNGQIIVDEYSQIVVAHDVSQDENDRQLLAPMLDRCREQSGEIPRVLLADAGYWSTANAELETDTTELLIATVKDQEQRKKLRNLPAPRGRIPKSATVKDRMDRKLLTKRGKEAYKRRSAVVEPVFGQMVMRGLNAFLLRGIEKVRTEWSLWVTTHNLLKLWRSGWVIPNTA